MTSDKKTKGQKSDKNRSKMKDPVIIFGIPSALISTFCIITPLNILNTIETVVVIMIGLSSMLASIMLITKYGTLIHNIVKDRKQAHPAEQDNIIQPPKAAEDLLKHLLPKEIQSDILGDLEEEFGDRYSQSSYKRAVWWYYWQVLTTLWSFLWRISKEAVQRIK